MDVNQTYTPGEVVYIIIRNPHAQDVANIQQAAVVENPDNANEMALFIHDTYYPLTDEFAIFKSEAEAEQVFRFSINDDYIIKYFEPGTSRLDERINAAIKVAEAGYPLGFIVAPIYLHDNWKRGYHEMFEKLRDALPEFAKKDLTFEMIQHRFTKPAKRVIQENYPMTKLELDEEKRKWKYVYPDEEQEDIKDTLGGYIKKYFPEAKLEYFT